ILPAWTVEVADTGIGVPEEELERIFIPFYESTRTQSKAGGRGLGLAVTKAIVEVHHGKIEAFNNEANGLTVKCTLPRLHPAYQNHSNT
ncbi:MAG: sensor histidine kinase, partial [Burkholderiales bacterium]